jgi:hypothetical protein
MVSKQVFYWVDLVPNLTMVGYLSCSFTTYLLTACLVNTAITYA